MNYYDILFARKMAGGQGEITTEGLSVTENGTYTAPEGKAYTPVVVNVPTPDDSYQLKSLPIGAISTITDGSNLPMPSLKVGIEPIQEGSGDPSPTNIRPISGHTEANVIICGKNIATTEIYKNNYVLAEDGAENYAGGFIITKEIKINSSNNYYISMVGGQTSSYDAIRVGFFDKFLNFISRINLYVPTQLIIPDNAEYIRLSYRYIESYFKDIQIELGSTATAYEPYNGQTYTIDLDGTRYGGTLDVVNGVLTVDKGYIASYNGETLPSTWISDRDVYVEGTSPTTGAQVVYELATPLTIQLTPTMVKSLLDTNNIWADTGDVLEGSYFKEL